MRPIIFILAVFVMAACSSGSTSSSDSSPGPITPPQETVVQYTASVAVDDDNLAPWETATIVFTVVNQGDTERPVSIRLLGGISGLSPDPSPGETWTQAITHTNNRVEVDPAFVVPQTDTYTYEVVVDGEVTQTLSYSITTTPALISGST